MEKTTKVQLIKTITACFRTRLILANLPTNFQLRQNPIKDGAISGFSGQKSVPE